MPDDFKKKIKNPTYMAESYEYLSDQNSKISKGFDKASVFKKRKEDKPKETETSEESAFVKADGFKLGGPVESTDSDQQKQDDSQ